MDYQEAIENHIKECRHRIDVIRRHVNTNGDADTDVCNKNIEVLGISISAMQKLQQYKQLGTLEEVGEAVERHKEIKPIEMVHDSDRIFDMGKSYNCHMCGSGLRYRYSVCEPIDNYCAICGQKIDWSEENEIN